MQNTFSRSFNLDETTQKKFYFVPEKSNGVLKYLVHINNDVEVKKFTLEEENGAWKIKDQKVKLPEWLFKFETEFTEKIKEALATQN